MSTDQNSNNQIEQTSEINKKQFGPFRQNYEKHSEELKNLIPKCSKNYNYASVEADLE